MATAAHKRRNSARGARRRDEPRNRWTQPAGPVTFGREEFRFSILRRERHLPALNIDPFVEHANWGRQGSARVGELNFRRPLTARGASEIASGDTVRCEIAPWGRGRWRPLWQMTVSTPSDSIVDGTISLALTAQLTAAEKNKASFKFRKDKHHPNGWTADEITHAVAKRFHIPTGRIAKGHHRIARLIEKSLSPVDVVTKAWARERTHTGRRYDIDVSKGRLEVLELRRPWYMLLLGKAITNATVEHRIDGIASALIVTATRHHAGKRAKDKLRVKVTDPGRLRRYGYIVKTIKAPRSIDTLTELRKYAKRRLARLYAPRPQVTFTHPGLPWVDRGDAIKFSLPEDGLEQIVYVTDVRHDLSAGSYTMDVTVRWTDPWLADERKARVTRKKEAAAARRRREHARTRQHAKPKKSRTRGHA